MGTAKLVHKVGNDPMKVNSVVETTVCARVWKVRKILEQSMDLWSIRTRQVDKVTTCDRHALGIELSLEGTHAGLKGGDLGGGHGGGSTRGGKWIFGGRASSVETTNLS